VDGDKVRREAKAMSINSDFVNKCNSRIRLLSSQIERLLSAEAISIAALLDAPDRHKVPGVYVISTPNDDEIVYIGKTRTGTIASRLKDHRSLDDKQAKSSSDLRGMLSRNRNYPSKPEEYLVRYFQIDQEKDRHWFEHFAIGVLAPPFNK
jgi:hypothetical protein